MKMNRIPLLVAAVLAIFGASVVQSRAEDQKDAPAPKRVFVVNTGGAQPPSTASPRVRRLSSAVASA